VFLLYRALFIAYVTKYPHSPKRLTRARQSLVAANRPHCRNYFAPYNVQFRPTYSFIKRLSTI